MPLPPRPPATSAALAQMEGFHSDIVAQVIEAVAKDDVVVIGMAWNMAVKGARRQLDEANVAHTYVEFGNYTNHWRQRLAIKLWSGWPTFPQVFVKGQLVGGASDLRAAMADGTFRALLDAPRP